MSSQPAPRAYVAVPWHTDAVYCHLRRYTRSIKQSFETLSGSDSHRRLLNLTIDMVLYSSLNSRLFVSVRKCRTATRFFAPVMCLFSFVKVWRRSRFGVIRESVITSL
jgi:hypothetical protein